MRTCETCVNWFEQRGYFKSYVEPIKVTHTLRKTKVGYCKSSHITPAGDLISFLNSSLYAESGGYDPCDNIVTGKDFGCIHYEVQK